jgi:hypothetical protein
VLPSTFLCCTVIFRAPSFRLQERFFVLQRGLLTYYESQDDWEKGHEPIKGLRISVKYYKVDP